MANQRVRLKEDEYQLVMRHRALAKECKEKGLPMDSVNHYWYKGKQFSIHLKNNPLSYQDIRDKLIADMNQYSPEYKTIKRKKSKNNHLLVISPADVHIGKLASSFESGDQYNSEIAVKRVKEGIDGILEKSSGFNIDQILFIGGNDILHVDTPKATTTSGTFQNTSEMWFESFTKAKRLYIDILEQLMQFADVHFTFNPSNHDYISGFMLSDSIQSWFRKSKNITFDVSINHRKGYQYGSNLIGSTHGDGAKIQDLPLLLATEFPKFWSNTKHRYIYTHHVHHKVAKDYGSVCVEALRSPSGTDSWHHRNGYQHSPKAIEGFLHSKEHGQVARLTHLF